MTVKRSEIGLVLPRPPAVTPPAAEARKVAAEMSHTSRGIVFQHYRALVEPEEAACYWNLRPALAPANVVPMLAASA